MIKLKDILREADITVRNPHTHKTIKAVSALRSDDSNLVKKARKALGMDDKKEKENSKEKGNIFKKKDIKKTDKIDISNERLQSILNNLLKVKKHSEKLISIFKSVDKIDNRLEKKINSLSKNIIDIYNEISKK